MSLLSDYEHRTAWKYEPVCGVFHTADGLMHKVRTDGSYAPFPGSTVVFGVGTKELQTILRLQGEISAQLKDTQMLADPLPASTIHMTLHDLISPEMCASDPADKDCYSREMNRSLEKAVQIVQQIRREFEGRSLTMEADRIVSMMSKSLVLMLRPKTERDYELLLDMYSRFDEVVRLPYPLTPHITLAYYRPGLLDGDRLAKAMDRVQISPDSAPVFEFMPQYLAAQTFGDMQTYMDAQIPPR